MAQSLFQRKVEANPAGLTPHELIEHEVAHLKKRGTARHGDKPHRSFALGTTLFILCAVLGLYILDPIMHAWYRYDAIHAYTYLHNFGVGKEADELATSGLFRPEEIVQLDRNLETDKDDYATPQDAAKTARTILHYMASVKALHAGRYEQLDWFERFRYDIFIRAGLMPPTAWDFLDPDVPNDVAPAPPPAPAPAQP